VTRCSPGAVRTHVVGVLCGVAVATVAALAGAAFVLPSAGCTPSLSAPPAQPLPRPPAAAGPTALDRPEVVGSDPTLFHLDLTGLPGRTTLSRSGWGFGAPDEETMRRLIAGLRPVTGTDPALWPVGPFG